MQIFPAGPARSLFVGPILAACVLAVLLIVAPPARAAKENAPPQKPLVSERSISSQAMDELLKAVMGIMNDPGLGDAEKKQKAMTFVRNFRYGADNQGYFWVADNSGLMLVNPFNSELEGKNQLGLKDINDKRFIAEALLVARDKGEGVVDYLWPRPGGEKPVLTVALIRLFKEWNWIIGTGSYPETVEAYEEPTIPRFYTPLTPPPLVPERPASPT